MLPIKFIGLGLALGLAATGATAADPPQVSFKKDVQPLLQASCLECHSKEGKGTQKSGLLLDSYEHLMQGTKYGPIVDPGQAVNSVLIQVVEGKQIDPSIAMPHGGHRMSEASIKVLRDWVNQGAKNN
jgi:hypothetical protein